MWEAQVCPLTCAQGPNGPLCSPVAAEVPVAQALALGPTSLFPVLPGSPQWPGAQW